MGENSGNGLVWVGVPVERMLLPSFTNSRDMVINHLRQINRYGGIVQVPGCRIELNRNRIVEEFLKDTRQAEWLLFLDDDMTFPPTIGERLARFKQPVVSGLYFQRGPPYDPLCYERVDDKPDSWGRLTPFFKPLRDQAYDFLVWNGAPSLNGPLTVDNPDVNPLMACDSAGGGALLVHRSVFETMSPPWFEFRGELGEDFDFCLKVKQLGFPIYADFSTVCGHLEILSMGQVQFRQAYEQRGFQMASYNMHHATYWASNFFGMEAEKAQKNLTEFHPRQMAKEWSKRSPQTGEDVMNFYTDPGVGEMYVYDLLRWNQTQLFQDIRTQLIPFRNQRVLEIGGGIGTIAIQMAFQNCNVLVVEPNALLRDFMQYRWAWTQTQLHRNNRRGVIRFVADLPKEDIFDLVIGVDVFEHIHSDSLPRLLKQIGKLTPERGRLFHHNNWGQQDLFPFHYDHSQTWDTWLRTAGWYPVDPPLWSLKIK